MSNYGNNLPRSRLTQPREGYPVYGAVHEVIPTTQIRDFQTVFAIIADQVFDQTGNSEIDPVPQFKPTEEFAAEIITPPLDKPFDSRDHYRIFNPETLGLSVIEMDPSSKKARQIRTVWEKQDFGAVEKDARNELLRHLPNRIPTIKFTGAKFVGGILPGAKPSELVRQKVALIPDSKTSFEILEIVNLEANIIIRAIRARLKQFAYQYDIVPHVTFAVFKKGVERDQAVAVVDGIHKHLIKKPLHAQLSPLVFRSRSERRFG